jgi:hypothetical protein
VAIQKVHRVRVFNNSVLRRMFGNKRVDVIGGWRQLHNEELCNSYSSPNIIRLIKSRMMRWAEHVWERIGTHMEFWWESQKEKRPGGRPR